MAWCGKMDTLLHPTLNTQRETTSLNRKNKKHTHETSFDNKKNSNWFSILKIETYYLKKKTSFTYFSLFKKIIIQEKKIVNKSYFCNIFKSIKIY